MHKILKALGVFILSLFFSLTSFFVPGFAQRAVYTDNFYDVGIVGENVWIVGYYGSILYSKDRGENWIIQQSNAKRALFSLFFVGDRMGWSVGSSGIILFTENKGTTWIPQSSNTKKKLFDVFFIDEKRGWVSGDQGIILRTDNSGKIWEDVSLNEDISLYSIWFADTDLGWVVGEFGVIFRTEDGGRTWTKQKSPIETTITSPDSQCLFKLRFINRNIGLSVGMDGGILYTQDGGEYWQAQPKTVKEHILDFLIINDNRIFAVGRRGLAGVIGYNPNTFVFVELGVRSDLNGICFGDEGLGFIVGNKGTILRSLDGGKSWKQLNIKEEGIS